jgi:hypothetical protein
VIGEVSNGIWGRYGHGFDLTFSSQIDPAGIFVETRKPSPTGRVL